MPSVRYLNQTAPFWDFIANLEEQGTQHPFFGNSSQNTQFPHANNTHPWAWAWGGPRHWPRGPHHPSPPDNGEGPSNRPAPPADGDHPPPPPGPDGHPAPPPPEHEGMPHRPHPHHHRGRSHERRGRRHGPWGRGPCGGFPLNDLGAFLNNPLFGQESNNNTTSANSGDFAPEADVFDTESSFVIHVSLPGAKKEDVGVNWDAEKSELSVAGVVYRPGDEDFLKTLALDERRVGAFERKIRLGSRANPAQVDADAISAKLEDGILRVEVPKLDKDYVEIKKVDIE